MKIGLITFHRARNYGAILQTYSLYLKLSEYGECEVIDYIPNNECFKRSFFRRVLHTIKILLLLPKYIELRKKDTAFNELQKCMVLSERTYHGDSEIALEPPHFDVLFSGSDQILNTEITGSSKAYYLFFEKDNSKKNSYASSFGRDIISKTEEEFTTRYLKQFSNISVRETSCGRIISQLTSNKTTLVVDPVFLQTEKQWSNYCCDSFLRKKIKKKYIFVYYMEKSDELLSAIQYLEKKTKLPVICIDGGNSGRIGSYRTLSYCGPKDYIYLIKNAEYIITNSFHGLSFSLILKKNVLSVAHKTKNARLYDLLCLVGQEGKQINQIKNDYSRNIIIGDVVFGKLENVIIQSNQFIEKCIENVFCNKGDGLITKGRANNQ